MKLFLFGGAELENNQVDILKNLIKKVLLDLHPEKILHIPYARLVSYEKEWEEGWFNKVMADTGIKILDARKKEDLENAKDAVIFINGGRARYELSVAIKNNPKLLSLVLNAKNIVSESSGSMVLGEKLRKYRANEGDDIVDGVGLLKGVIIEPHYTARHSEELLKNELLKSGMKYGLGIDSFTAIVVDPNEFPSKWEKIGTGNIFIIDAKKSSDLL